MRRSQAAVRVIFRKNTSERGLRLFADRWQLPSSFGIASSWGVSWKQSLKTGSETGAKHPVLEAIYECRNALRGNA